jgi:multicomponent Na+:H+ antiporter subunit D
VIADGALKGAFFLAIAVVVIRLGSSDELRLRGSGRGREHVVLGGVFLLCGLGLAALPPFGPFLSQSLIVEAARGAGYAFVVPLVTLATLLTGAAVLRATGRIFLGLGPAREPLLAEQPDEPEEGEPEAGKSRRSEALLLLPPIALLVIALGVSFVPGIASHAVQQAGRFQDRAGYAAEVLRGKAPVSPPLITHRFETVDWVWGMVSVLGALGLAALLLFRDALPSLVRSLCAAPIRGPARVLKAANSGAIGDYAMWITVGAAAFSVVWGALLR